MRQCGRGRGDHATVEQLNREKKIVEQRADGSDHEIARQWDSELMENCDSETLWSQRAAGLDGQRKS